MKTLALLTLALLAVGSAHAAGSSGEQEYNEHNRPQFQSTQTRAEVIAQYVEAARSGNAQPNSEMNWEFAVNQQAGSGRDVGAVKDEAVLAARTRIVQELMV